MPTRLGFLLTLWTISVPAIGGVEVATAQTEPMRPKAGTKRGQVIQSGSHRVGLLVDSLGNMAVRLWNVRAEPERAPDKAQVTLRGGGGDQYSITLQADIWPRVW